MAVPALGETLTLVSERHGGHLIEKLEYIGILAEAGFSEDQTNLKWHLGQVGPTKFDHFREGKKSSFRERTSFLGPTWPKFLHHHLLLTFETLKMDLSNF